MTKIPKSSQLLMFILRTVSSVGGYISTLYQAFIYSHLTTRKEKTSRKTCGRCYSFCFNSDENRTRRYFSKGATTKERKDRGKTLL